MVVVDSHCHASREWYEPIETLLFEMDRYGVEQAVLIQINGQYDTGGAPVRDEQALTRALRFANGVGAITTTRHGAIPALLTRAQVEALLRSTVETSLPG